MQEDIQLAKIIANKVRSLLCTVYINIGINDKMVCLYEHNKSITLCTMLWKCEQMLNRKSVDMMTRGKNCLTK